LSNKNITIAIVDSGVNLHSDLNIVGRQSCVSSGKLDDDYDHGNHVAGVATAKNNHFGVVGVAPGAKIISIKVGEMIGNKKHATTDNLRCALNIINNTKGIDIVNISMEDAGNPHATYGALANLIKDIIKENITVVGSAGNYQQDAQREWPGMDPNIITVGAISDSDGKCGGTGKIVEVWSNEKKPPGILFENGKALSDKDDSFANSYSNFGNAVDIVAPGTNILSTNNNNSYSEDSGTSFAAPYVTGAAAIYKAYHPNANSSEVLNALLNSAWKSPNTSCFYTIDNPLKKPQTPELHVKPLENK
jgi:subtilisin